MADQPSTNVMNFFSEYVRLRQSGCPVDEAARDLQSAMRMLDKHELNELAMMTQHWEASYRTRPRMSVPTQRTVTGMLSREHHDLRAASSIRPIQAREPVGTESDNAMLAILIDEKPAIRPIQPKRGAANNNNLETCTKCGRPNQVGAAFCYACGEILLSSRSSSTRQLEETISTRRKLGASYFGARSKIIIEIANSGDRLEVFPTEHDIVIGRSTSTSAISPDIDLAHYDAEELGVSRLHVTIKRSDKSLTITDMNSSNKTYLNGQVLHSNEVRVLSDNDEIRLGRLYLRVRFIHPA
jgi:pSer/pThr/pTyr-binding forkhead associated (FHA) protein